MRTIWKYELPIADEFTIEMPAGAKVLCVQVQRRIPWPIPCLWAEVDTTREPVLFRFRLFGTGHDLPVGVPGSGYVGTFQTNEGAFVWHLYLWTDGAA